MSQLIRVGSLSLLNRTGIFRLVRELTKGQIRILAYHRFGKNYITPRLFEIQIEYLKKHFNIINLRSYLDFLFGQKKLRPCPLIITVDDGYQDFYIEAFPILRKYAVPATVFLTVDFIDKGIWLWHDLLNFSLNSTHRKDFTLNGRVFDLRNHIERSELKILLDKICTSCSTSERDAFIKQILKELNVKVPEHPTTSYVPLTWSQILEMSKCGVSYGAHTCTHPILSRISPDEALCEIRKSKQRIEEVIQNDISAFCYPNGKEDDFNEGIKEMVRQCGFTCAFSMIYGLNDLNSDRYALRRMAAHGESFLHFLHDVSGFGVLRHSFPRWKNKLD